MVRSNCVQIETRTSEIGTGNGTGGVPMDPAIYGHPGCVDTRHLGPDTRDPAPGIDRAIRSSGAFSVPYSRPDPGRNTHWQTPENFSKIRWSLPAGNSMSLESGQAMGHAHHRNHRCAGGHRSPVSGGGCQVPGDRSQVPGVGSHVSGIPVAGICDGRRKTGDGASHGLGIAHDRMGTHGVPWPVPIAECLVFGALLEQPHCGAYA